MNQLEKTIISMEVAEMVGREHKEVLRDIRNIISQLGESKIAQSYFIESTYRNSQNREMPSFLLTKKGCELYATRMTGEKGTQFAVQYIERFNQLERRIKKQPQQVPSLEIALQAALEHEREIKTIKSDVNYLKGNMRIDSLQQQKLQKYAKAAVVKALGGKDTNAYREMSKKVFPLIWNEFKNYFEIPRYPDLPKIKFDEAVQFIKAWQPDTSTRLEINQFNQQQAFQEVFK